MTSLDSFCFENGSRSGRRSIAPNGSGRWTLFSMVYSSVNSVCKSAGNLLDYLKAKAELEHTRETTQIVKAQGEAH